MIPLRRFWLGTRCFPCTDWKNRRGSKLVKKKVLFFLRGPPRLNPPRLSRIVGRATNLPVGSPVTESVIGVWLLSQEFALRAVFCTYQYTSPWNSLVPVRLSVATWPPAARPNVAFGLAIPTRNSEMVSTLMGMTVTGLFDMAA